MSHDGPPPEFSALAGGGQGPAFAELDVGAHGLALLRDGEQAFPRMLGDIARAESSVCLETYIFRDDRTGRAFGDVLMDRAAAGVEVSVLFDAWGSSVSERFLQRLRHAGVRVLPFRPVGQAANERRFLRAVWRRDHKKTLVVDGMVGYTGGINVSDDYAPVSAGGGGWRDTHLRIAGPAARELLYFFLRTWRREHGPPFDEERYVFGSRRPDPHVQVISSERRRGRNEIGREYRDAIGSARSRILITNAYFLPTVRLFYALTEAARRGVEVRIIVAGATDVPAVRYAARSIYGRLLRAGVRVHEYVGRVLHAKTAVVDGAWSTVGSSNLDSQSLKMNLEVNAIVRSGAFAASLERMFADDLLACEEVTLEAWTRRGPLERAISFGAYLFKDYL